MIWVKYLSKYIVTGIIESEPSENSYNRNVWEKNQNFRFLIFIPKHTLWNPHLT